MRFLMTGGGTGGGLFPSIAVVDALSKRNPEHRFLFVGTSQGFEAKWLSESKYEYRLVDVKGLKGKKWVSRLTSLMKLPSALWRSWKILGQFKPDLVFGSGGYVAGPMVMASALQNTPTAILEPNAIPGFTTRILSHFVDKIFLAFEEAQSFLPREKCIFTGNPIREDIESVKPPTFERDTLRVLIFGGSQGARKINEAIMEALPRLDLSKFEFVHQTGVSDHKRVEEAYRNAGANGEALPFIDDMAAAYEKADVVIARAGSSVLEILACGLPSILVPYPWAADDHQRANAAFMEREGASVVIENDVIDGEELALLLNGTFADRDRLQSMRDDALRARRLRAADSVAMEMEKLVGGDV